MKSSWKNLRLKLIENTKDIFENSTNPKFNNFEEGIDLFYSILCKKTGIKNLDGLEKSIMDSILDGYVNKVGQTNPVKTLVNNIEPFLKKIKFITTGVDCSQDRNNTFMPLLKEYNILSQNSTGDFPFLDENLLKTLQNSDDNFLKYVCLAYIARNHTHNSPNWNLREVLDILESSIVVYIYATLQNYQNISPIVDPYSPKEIKNDSYQNYILSVLNKNHSLQMLESDFGVKIPTFEEFEIKVKAKAKKMEDEKGEYLNGNSKQKAHAIKLLPDISGIWTNKKNILLHGIATSGKSTSLKKIGKEFIELFDSPYVFYIELGQIVNFNIDSILLNTIKNEYNKITNCDIDINNLDDKCLLLLDGLDEITENENRNKILKEIYSYNSINDLRIVLSSRTNDYITTNQTLENYFEKFELLPINLSDIIHIGEKIINDNSNFNNFVKIVKQGELIKAFPKTPLTSILLAILFKEKAINVKELPKNITELYSKFIDLFLNRWDKSRGLSEQFKIQKKELILQKIAIFLHKQRKTSISIDELEKFVQEILTKKNEIQTANEYLNTISERTGILIKDDFSKTYRFFHLTIQEFLASNRLDYRDEDELVLNFYDEWWLNPNIFYAGKKSEYHIIIDRITKFEYYPTNIDAKFNFVAHTSKVLLAAHSIDSEYRLNALRSMVKIFNELSIDLINELLDLTEFVSKTDNPDNKLVKISNQSLLDVILNLRGIFMEFFNISDFIPDLSIIWEEIINSKNTNIIDITLYCISYCLSIEKKDAKFLEEFVITENYIINARWYKIVNVDIDNKGLNNPNNPIKLKIIKNQTKNKKYIQEQFNERIQRHYNSIVGISPRNINNK